MMEHVVVHGLLWLWHMNTQRREITQLKICINLLVHFQSFFSMHQKWPVLCIWWQWIWPTGCFWNPSELRASPCSWAGELPHHICHVWISSQCCHIWFVMFYDVTTPLHFIGWSLSLIPLLLDNFFLPSEPLHCTYVWAYLPPIFTKKLPTQKLFKRHVWAVIKGHNLLATPCISL